jgi:CheY-like chemotaxis protein
MLPRLVVADEAPEFLQRVLSLLAVGFNVVATAADGKEALELIDFHHPDVAILNYHMDKLSGLDVTRYLVRNPPSPPVVICSVETHSLIIEAARRAGALGYVFKRSVQRDLVWAVKSALVGRFFRSHLPLGQSQPVPLERRGLWRHVFGGLVELSTIPPQTPIIGSTVDICRLGCFVQTGESIPAGTKIWLKITHDGSQFTAIGEVVHVLSGRGIGINFTEVAPKDAALLKVWLE